MTYHIVPGLLRTHRLRSSLVFSLLCSSATASVPVQPGHSGGWWNPARSGEGLQIEVLSADTALVIWYTYPALDDGREDEQLWIGGPGRIEHDRIVIDPTLISRGPTFGPEFDTSDLEQGRWGSLSIQFTDCHRARLDWTGLPAYESGSIDLQRLTGNPRVPCAEPDPEDGSVPEALPPDASAPGLSGTWYDPAHSGEGWFVQEILPGLAVVMWFSYDGDGRPAYFLGVGELTDRSLIARDVERTRGTFFGDDFDATVVEREAWGDLHLVFDDCQQANLTWRSPLAEFGSGHLRPRRLTRADVLDCRFPPRVPIENGHWQRATGAPPLSELPAAALGEHVYVAGGFGGSGRQVWRFDPASGNWLRRADLPASRHHGQLAALDGFLYFFGGFTSRPGTGFEAQREGWRYDPRLDRWSAIEPLPIAKGAGAALAFDDAIYLVAGDASNGLRYEPAADSWSVVPMHDPVSRDHATAVRFQDEIWILGGRDPFSGLAHNQVTIFSPLTGVSRSGPPMRHARSGSGATVLDGRIVVAGGETLSGPALIATAEAYDPQKGDWIEVPPLPTPAHGMAVATMGNRAWFLLGSIQAGVALNPGIVQSYRLPGD